MASLLNDIQSYWTATPALASLGSLWLTSPPDYQAYPYFVLNQLSQIPTWSVGNPYFETASFQIDLYHTSAATISTYLLTLKTYFDMVRFSANVLNTYRENAFILQDAAKVFHGVFEFSVLSGRSLASPVGIAPSEN